VARNTPIQGTAADVLKLAMVSVEGSAGAARMVLTVHDELVFEVPEGKAKEEGERIRALMAGAMKLAVPLVVDVGVGSNWADAH
jgi:DNA polymerase-1